VRIHLTQQIISKPKVANNFDPRKRNSTSKCIAAQSKVVLTTIRLGFAEAPDIMLKEKRENAVFSQR
jgi:hypothetical protein